MYLKSIEVHGFKSFANKINFQFHNGITGIVGPNGSGKSNVADAVRWVLGEQRIKQLRGSSMQDVIFSGTENRKPIGYAYVAITLDNSDHQLPIDYEEVKIARRIYRSGESEYLLNGNVCRLRDVNELFYDTGIGKEGYSIIGQGQIDKILSGKPEERRELFDEAAGIVKFKRRKATAQKKLEDEEQNLVRVEDILGELEKQVGPLEKQAEAAKEFLKMKESLKFYDVNKFLLENKQVKDKLDDVEEKYKISKADLESISDEYDEIKSEYEQIEVVLEELAKTIEDTRGKLTETEMIRGKLEGEINVLKEQINSANSNEKLYGTRLELLNTQIETKSTECSKLLEEKNVLDSQFDELNDKKEVIRNELLLIQEEIEKHNTFIEDSKNSIMDKLNERASIRAKMAKNESTFEQASIRSAQLDAQFISAKSDEQKQDEVILKLESDFEEVSCKIKDNGDREKDIEEEISKVKNVLVNCDVKLQEVKEKFHIEKTKLDTISNFNERYDGYGASVRRVMEYKKQKKGIIGVVADIFSVDKKYEVAIEIALGGNIQNIVVENENDAKDMINILKTSKGGRATFLPLTSIKNPKLLTATDCLMEKGVIGRADELISIDSKYENVAKSLLGRIVVVDNMENALKIAPKYGYTVRIVTLEGEMLIPGGAISGGTFKNSSNLLSKKRELEELEIKVGQREKEIDELSKEINEIKENRGELRKKLEETKKEAQQLFIEQNTVRLTLSKEREKRKEVEQGYYDLENERNEISILLSTSQSEKENIILELDESEKVEKEIEAQITKRQEVLEELRNKECVQNTLVQEHDVLVEAVSQKQGFANQNVERIQGDIEGLINEKNEVIAMLDEYGLSVSEKLENIKELKETIKASHTVQSDDQLKLSEEMTRKEALIEKQKNFFNKREESSKLISSLDKEVYRLNAQREKLEDTVAAQINYMWDEYGITISDAGSLQDESMNDLDFMKKEVVKLKEQIKALGNVNVNAIEDYKELMERYDFLNNQHEDLVEAREVLNKIIEELDSSMRKQFHEKFEEIAREFDHVFKELFGGGKGTLELMEDEDVLDAGIKIIAQPPGKKLQNMMQLSGGEKALAAIALLFAIQNLKPSPFCLLDEIEAALDESNVTRFAKYLSKLTRHTQFIVITHRRGTMEKADRLYGITMQEKGVSALVSVNLIDEASLT